MHKVSGMEKYWQPLKLQPNDMQYLYVTWLMSLGLVCLCSQKALAMTPDSKESLDEIYQRVFGKNEALPTELVADLRIMGKSLGEANIQTDGAQITHLPSSLLQTSLHDYLKPELYDKIKPVLNQALISLQSLQAVGISTSYNRLDLAVEVKIAPKSLNRRMRSVLSALAGQGTIIPERLAEPAKISGYVNVFSDFAYQAYRHSADTSVRARLETALNIQGYVLEQQFTYQPDTPQAFTRNYTRVVIDDVENESRYQFGDIQTPGRNFQSGLALGGVQWLHDMNWPSAQVYRPPADYKFTLDSAAEVQVYQDGKLTQTVRLNAGEHTLTSIQATQGTEIELRIKNDFGQVSVQRFSRFTDSRLLSPDMSRYAISAGFPSSYENNKLHYDRKRKVVSAYYQRGVTDTLTAGVDLQSDGSHHQVGADAIWATRIGTLSAGVTRTKRDQQQGQALRLQLNKPYRANAGTQSGSQWSLSAEHYSRQFQPFTVSKTTQTQALQWQVNGQMSYQFNQGLNLSLSGSHANYYSGETSHSLNLGLSQQLSKRVYVSVSAQQQNDVSGKQDRSLYLNLNMALDSTKSGRSQSLNASYNQQNQASQLNYNLGSQGRYGLASLSSNARLEHNPHTQQTSLNTRWQQSTWDGAANIQQTRTNQQRQTRANLNLNTAWVFADGAVTRSKPVSDSFAILEAPTGLTQAMAASQGKSLFARSEQDPQGLPERYDVLIPPEGKAALSSLGSYNVQHISTDSHVLPENLDLNATEFDVLPDYKSGYRLKVGGERGVNLQVKVLNAQGQLLAFQAAHLVATKQKKLIQTVFTDADGVIHIPNLGSGSYRLEWLNRPASQPTGIEVTASAGQTQTLELRLP